MPEGLCGLVQRLFSALTKVCKHAWRIMRTLCVLTGGLLTLVPGFCITEAIQSRPQSQNSCFELTGTMADAGSPLISAPLELAFLHSNLFPRTEDSECVRKFFSVCERSLVHPRGAVCFASHYLGILVLQGQGNCETVCGLKTMCPSDYIKQVNMNSCYQIV